MEDIVQAYQHPSGASLNFVRIVDGCQAIACMHGSAGPLRWLRTYQNLLKTIPPLPRPERSLLHGILLSLVRRSFCAYRLNSRQLCEIVEATNATFAALERVPCVDVGPVNDGRVAEALRFIETNYQDPNLSVAGVATHVNLSPSRFEHLFVRWIGMRCSQYVAHVRVEHVAELLMSSCLSIKQIAAESGYVRVSALDHQFRRYVGSSPTAFRTARGGR